jgi:hypothetical protein
MAASLTYRGRKAKNTHSGEDGEERSGEKVRETRTLENTDTYQGEEHPQRRKNS